MYSIERIKKLLHERMSEYFAPGKIDPDVWRLNLDKLAAIVSEIEDVAYSAGYDDGASLTPNTTDWE